MPPHTTETWIKKALTIHKGKYDYSKVAYVNHSTPIIIICTVCGTEFLQKPAVHIQGSGCKACCDKNRGNALRLTTSQFVEKAVSVHGDKYDYSLVDYKGTRIGVQIKCQKCGMTFSQIPNTHLRGAGCPDCANAHNAQCRTLTPENIMKRAREIHGDKFDYGEDFADRYTDIMESMEFKCRDCGRVIRTSMNSHLNHKTGCVRCQNKEKLTTDVFIVRSRDLHGDKHYDYSKVADPLPNNNSKVTLICLICGLEFQQLIRTHLSGHGCIRCAEREPYTRETFIKRSKETHPDQKYDYSEVPENPRAVDYIPLIHLKCGKRFIQKVSVHLLGSGCSVCRKSRSEETCRRLFESLFNKPFPSARPDWLEGLFLDGYCEEIDVAFEYQGIQHYQTIAHFGVDEAKLAAQQERDQRKRELCESYGVTLIEIPYMYDYRYEEEMTEFIISELQALDLMDQIDATTAFQNESDSESDSDEKYASDSETSDQDEKCISDSELSDSDEQYISDPESSDDNGQYVSDPEPSDNDEKYVNDPESNDENNNDVVQVSDASQNIIDNTSATQTSSDILIQKPKFYSDMPSGISLSCNKGTVNGFRLRMTFGDQLCETTFTDSKTSLEELFNNALDLRQTLIKEYDDTRAVDWDAHRRKEIVRQKVCLNCDTKVSNTSSLCQSCANKVRSGKPEKQELINRIRECKGDLSAVGRLYLCTDTAVRKWLVKYGYTKDQIKHRVFE